MKRILRWVCDSVILTLSTTFFASCSETVEVGEFEGDWDQRNYAFIDSVASIARSNYGDEVGQWKILRTYKQNEGGMMGSSASSQDFVFAKIMEKGAGTVSPVYTDSVTVHYRGRLIPTASYPEGKIFDQNYYGELNSETAQWAPSSTFACNGVIEGWTTALMYMHEGDYWRLYVPEEMAYGSKGSSGGVPGYATLIFDVYLKKIKKAGR